MLGELDTEYEGWRRVKTSSGNEGWAPEAYVDVIGDGGFGIALADYTAAELDVSYGEYVDISFEHAGWSWVVKGNGEQGWIPNESIEPTPQ